MRIIIQRVTQAAVVVGLDLQASIGKGMMVLVGIECGDTADDVRWLVDKTAALRIFDDENGVMNLSLADVGGDVLAVSQFTLTASTRKGNRPSYIRAAPGSESQPLYELYCTELERRLGRPVGRGVFGADMKVSLTNDGPVTIMIDSKLRE